MNMMNRSPQRLCTHDDVLNAVIDEIAVSPATVSLVTERYQAIADWLGRDGSTLQGHDPHVYVQPGLFIQIGVEGCVRLKAL